VTLKPLAGNNGKQREILIGVVERQCV